MNADQALEHLFAQAKDRIVSVELFPPDLDDPKIFQRFSAYLDFLCSFSLDFVSVTFGAGGSKWETTSACVALLKKVLPLPILVHITCVNLSVQQVDTLVAHFYSLGIRNFLVLRGDTPAGEPATISHASGEHFDYALDMLRYLQSRYPDCSYFVAGFPEGHPTTPHRIAEMDFLQEKCAAGASGVITQMCFSHYDVNDFIARLRLTGVHTPVCVGLLPFRAHLQVDRILSLALGTRMPAPLLRLLSDAKGDPLQINEACTQYFFHELELMEGYNGIHLYLLNNRKTAEAILPRIYPSV